jgi:cell division transport system permease protein
MAQFGKSSSKRGKPSYAYAIIGVSLVLFLFGFVAWIFLGIRKQGDRMKENIQLHTYISPSATAKQVDSLKNYVKALPYAINVEYISKEAAAAKYNSDNDTSWKHMLDYNPLPASVDFYVKAGYMQKDSLKNLEDVLMGNYGHVVSEFQYPLQTVNFVSNFIKNFMLIVLLVAIVLCIIVIVSIDNTIRLAMYSNRFLIKTMQMVGATRGFIARPIVIRSLINGLIAGIVAIFILYGVIWLAEQFVPYLQSLRDNKNLILIGLGITILGIFISVFSTYRSVLKYLQMKLDDLY